MTFVRDLDLRHYAITELAESQASDRTIMSIAGHVSQQMLAHYSHVRIEAKRKAPDALAVGIKTAGYDTNNDTKPVEDAILSSQIPEKNGGDDGTRTRGLCRDSEKSTSIFNDFESTDGDASHWKYVVSKTSVYRDVYRELN
jgi:hypothetical protein